MTIALVGTGLVVLVVLAFHLGRLFQRMADDQE